MIRFLPATAVLAAFSGPCSAGDERFSPIPAETALTVVQFAWDDPLHAPAPGVRFELQLERPAQAERATSRSGVDQLSMDIVWANEQATSVVAVELSDCAGETILPLPDVVASSERGPDVRRRVAMPDPFVACASLESACTVQRCLALTLVDGPAAWVGGSWVIGTAGVVAQVDAVPIESATP